VEQVTVDPKQSVLIIGGGAREHALAWKLARSPELGRLYVAPGNGGTETIAENLPISTTDTAGLTDFARKKQIDLVIVGPDDALAAGVVDAFRSIGLRIYGPTRAAAQIETSKVYAKDVMTACNVPSARYETFADLGSAKRYAGSRSFPVVVKANGPAFGRGTYIARDMSEASRALDAMMGEKIFGEAGRQVVIEEYLDGQEVSIHAFCDGRQAVLFPPAQDHKRVGTGDTGPNTGGMGAYAPVPWLDDGLLGKVRAQVIDRVLAELETRCSPFTGTLYPGIMVESGEVKVLEINARFGDPETQSYMPLLDSDLLGILHACAGGGLRPADIKWSTKTALTVVLASDGYPGRYQTGFPITGVEAAEALPDVVVFHAGTRRVDGQLLTSGGRVLDVTAVGADLAQAQQKAYEAVKLIQFEGMQYRTDIGDKGLSSGAVKAVLPHGGAT
jgi:phosphoribosylamine---glycine ligase